MYHDSGSPGQFHSFPSIELDYVHTGLIHTGSHSTPMECKALMLPHCSLAQAGRRLAGKCEASLSKHSKSCFLQLLLTCRGFSTL